MSDLKFEKTWYMIPYKIRKLPGMTLALLDLYETIFEFWHRGNQCFLSNSVLMERTGIKSLTTIHEAFQYFEKHGVMKRVIKNNKRYIVQILSSETEDTGPVDNSSKNNESTPPGTGRDTTALVGGDTTALVGGDTSVVAHNNNNLSNKLNREKEDSKKLSTIPTQQDSSEVASLSDSLSIFETNEKGYEFNEEEKRIADRKELDIEWVFNKFINYLELKNRQYFTRSEFKSWLLNEKREDKKRSMAQPKGTVQFWGPGHPTYDSVYGSIN